MLNKYRSLHFELETTFKQIILSDKDHQPSWLHHHHHHWYVFLFSTWWSGLMSGGWSPGEWSSLTGEDDQNQRNNELSSWRIYVWLRWQISPDHHNSTTSTSAGDHAVVAYGQVHQSSLIKSQEAARLAQSVEHETLNLRVVGSSPTLGAIFFLQNNYFRII